MSLYCTTTDTLKCPVIGTFTLRRFFFSKFRVFQITVTKVLREITANTSNIRIFYRQEKKNNFHLILPSRKNENSLFEVCD